MARTEEVHTTSEGLATVTIYDDTDGQVLGVGHGFTLSDARAQAEQRAGTCWCDWCNLTDTPCHRRR